MLYYFGSNEKSLWAEWDLLESIFQTVDCLYPEWTLKPLSLRQSASSFSIDEAIYSLLEKTSSADEFNPIVEILIHDQSPYKASQGQFQQPTAPPPKPKKGLLSNVLGGGGLASHFKLSSSSSHH